MRSSHTHISTRSVRLGWTATCALVASTAASMAANAATWNLTAEFSIANGNPNGVWSYGWYSLNFETFTLCMTAVAPPHEGWLGYLGGDGTPGAWRNTTGSTADGVPNGWVSIHPGPGTEPMCVRWTAPAGVAGTHHIAGEFLPGDINSNELAVRHNGQVIWTASNAGTFNLTRQVSPGDTIEFLAYGNYLYGNTPVHAVIESGCEADLTGDDIVNGADLGVLLGQWSGQGTADLNLDGTVDGADLGALLSAWGACR